MLFGLVAIGFSSCDSYLDKLPDDRAELNDKDKITQFLTSCYPTVTNIAINELSSDNVGNNGTSYTTDDLADELYRMKDVDVTSNDSPYQIWNGFYESVASANQAIEAIKNMGDTTQLSGQLAEAKLCRAYSMLQMATTFCMAWNPAKAKEYLGLPYPTTPQTDYNAKYDRGTLAELYAHINQDIEEALPNVDDNLYTVPKYHWNLKAAYAFAARFNLYYMNYDKAITYATKALGDDPASLLRDYTEYITIGRKDKGNLYVKTTEKANFLLLPAYSTAARYVSYATSSRYGHNYSIAAYETYWATMPWGSGSSNNTLYWATMLYGNNQCAVFPKLEEFFEYTDKVAGSGYPHVVDAAFTADETLLVRAEAYALKKDYTHAIADMNLWVNSHCKAEEGTQKRPVLTLQLINDFYDKLDYAPAVLEGNRDRSVRKELHPQGFTVESGDQENVIEMILHMRRLETMLQGLRFYDLKRYGIEYSHMLSREDPVVFKAGDLRGAIQIPTDILQAGITANPR